MPGMVLGISLLLAFRQVGIQPGLFAIVVAHVASITPIVMFVVAQRLRALDPTLEQASKARRRSAADLRQRDLPVDPDVADRRRAARFHGLVRRGDRHLLRQRREQTLPVHIWTLLRQGFSPVVNAILTLIAVFSVVLITAATVNIARARRGVG